MYNNFRTISKTEIEDFNSSCQRFGFKPDEFKLKEHDVIEAPKDNGIFYMNGQLTISRNGKSKTYKTGNNTHWPTDFHHDLEKELFA